MPDPERRPHLPAILGFLHQARAEGELLLEQNDGSRRLRLGKGELRYLRSDAVGEQFGNYLIRLGVLDYNALKELLKEEGARVGEKVVQWGLLTAEQRDARLRELFANILLHAVEHPVLKMAWTPGAFEPGVDFEFGLEHRRIIWEVYRQMQTLDALVETFEEEPTWRWAAQDGLLDAMADLTLTPQLAFAISQLGREPMSFDTLASVTSLDEGEAARLIASLWALGGLKLVEGAMGSFDLFDETPREPVVILEPEPISAPPEPPPAEPKIQAQTPLAEAGPAQPAAAEAAPVAKARALFNQAESLSVQGRTSEAVRALEQATQLDPDSPRAYGSWMLLGDLRQGNPAWSTRAIEAYQIAARVQPGKGDPWVRMANLYQKKGFAANAAGCFRRALELDPSLELPEEFLEAEDAAPSHRESLLGRIKGLLGGEKR